MERVEDSNGDDRPKPNNLAAKIKKIDVPIKGILKKSNIFSDSSISSNQSMIGKETKFLVGDNDPNLNHEDLSIPGKCDSNLECDLNAYSADNVLKPGTNSNIGVSYASKLKSGKEIKPIHFRLLKSAEVLEDVDIVLPKEADGSESMKRRKGTSSRGQPSDSHKTYNELGFVDDEGIEIVYDETAKFMEAGVQPNSEGASTPGSMSFNG
ncbi:hypothetical protein L1987_78410 [Smallanthus sonchifolius]|uniref:Uncharacterized protein n=2 Tax=Smallanthus sonchifolius TaxID=185202 RepID=A0ACB8ZDL3_9ASTR|nr:hypothetical protein L1987_78406 [Smallanthus sonchifolius]KAI3695413.1 hypothetical protein L1987_78410 [Smallanthus sonchifolius]